MNAAQWRRAMNRSAAAAVQPLPAAMPSTAAPARNGHALGRWWQGVQRTVEPRHVAVLALVLVFPFVATPFLTFQVAAQALVLGLIALSLTFLGGYGGMGSVVGAAIGSAILGLAETYGLAYAPTYSVVFTFVILVLVLAFRPRGLLGRAG